MKRQPTIEMTRAFHDETYSRAGFSAQRRYPNEELLRFLGSRYFGLPRAARESLAVLEIGCGSGANLWMLAREGFTVHGVDLSFPALQLSRAMLAGWQANAAHLAQASMTCLPYAAGSFDLVVDVFSSYCLTETEFASCLVEVARVLRRGGRFFSYAPSKNSDAFRDHTPAGKIDPSTLDGIQRESAPYFGNLYPFRFVAPEEYAEMLVREGFTVLSNERIGRTYRNGAEYFEFVSIAAEKQGGQGVS
jgi:SAM-dependent methyltransferase